MIKQTTLTLDKLINFNSGQTLYSSFPLLRKRPNLLFLRLLTVAVVAIAVAQFSQVSAESIQWTDVGGKAAEIDVISNNNIGVLSLFSIGLEDNNTYYKYQLSPGGNWSSWVGLGGPSKQIDAVFNNNTGTLSLFSINADDNQPYYKYQLSPGGNWSDWNAIGGESKQIDALASDNSDRLSLFSIGRGDSRAYHIQQRNDTAWGDWELFGGESQSNSCNEISAITGKEKTNMMFFCISSDGSTLKFRTQPTQDYRWSPWIDIGTSFHRIDPVWLQDKSVFIFGIEQKGNTVVYGQIEEEAYPSLNNSKFVVEKIVDKELSNPSSMAFLNKTHLLILQKNDGRIMLISNGKLNPEPVLSLNVDGKGERGLLGIAIKNASRTDYSLVGNQINDKYVFVFLSHNNTGGNVVNNVFRYTWNGTDLVDPIKMLEFPSRASFHNGGKMKMNADGDLFVVVGEQNGTGLLQNVKNGSAPDYTGVLLKVNASDLNGQDNQTYVRLNNTIANYYAYGIRNSFGIDIDPVTNMVWQSENGIGRFDEINQINQGFNSGWRQLMGPLEKSNVTEDDLVFLSNSSYYSDPVFSWNHTIGVTDLEFIRSDKFGPGYLNNLLIGDIVNGNMYYLTLNSTRTGFLLGGNSSDLADLIADSREEQEEIIFATGFAGISDLETSVDGLIYVLTYFDGSLYRLKPN